MSNILNMPERCTPNTRRMYLQSQAAYIAAEAILRAVKLNPHAELCDLHIVEQQKYHALAERAIQDAGEGDTRPRPR